jgi:hypothetical protein
VLDDGVPLAAKLEAETEPAVFGMAFNTLDTKKDSTVNKLPADAPVAKTTVVPFVAV